MCCIHVYVVSNVRKDVADRKVIAHDAQGLKARDGLVFVEMWKWKERNPGKTPTPSMVDTCEVFQDDGSLKWEEGVWEREGEKGVHRFERYRDKQIRKEEVDDDGTCILSADQQDKKFDMAFKAFNIKAFTLDDIMAIPLDDAKEEEEKDDGEEPDSSEVDSDGAEKLEAREHTGLFDRKKVVAGRTAAAKPKPAAKGHQKPAAKGQQKHASRGTVSTSAGSRRSESSAHDASAASSPIPEAPPNRRRLTGKSPSEKKGNDDDADTQIGFVDGRAEKFRMSLNKSLDELTPKVNDLKQISLLDNEEYLGSGDEFKKQVKVLKGIAKALHTQCKNLVDRISNSAQPEQLKTENERAESMTKIADIVHSLCHTMLEATLPFENLSDSMNAATGADVSLSPTFYAVRIWKHVENLVSVDKPEEAMHIIVQGSTAVKELEQSNSMLDDPELKRKFAPSHIAFCAIEKTFETMLRAMKTTPGGAASSGARKNAPGMTAAFWAMTQAVASKKGRDDFLGKDHCNAAAIIAPLEKPDKISVDDLGLLLKHFIPTFLNEEADSVDGPCELDRDAPVLFRIMLGTSGRAILEAARLSYKSRVAEVGFGRNVVAIKDLCKTVSLFQADETELRTMIDRIQKLRLTVSAQAKSKQMKSDAKTVETAINDMYHALSRTPVQSLIPILEEAALCPICDAKAPWTAFDNLVTKMEEAEKLDVTWVGQILTERGKAQAEALNKFKDATQLRDGLMEIFTWSMQYRWDEASPLSDQLQSVFDSLFKSGSKQWSELNMDLGHFEIVEAMLSKFKIILESSQSKRTSIAGTALTKMIDHIDTCLSSKCFADAEASVAEYMGSITGARLTPSLQEAFQVFGEFVASLLRVQSTVLSRHIHIQL